MTSRSTSAYVSRNSFGFHLSLRLSISCRASFISFSVQFLPGRSKILGRADLMREPHRRQHQGVAHRLQGTQMFTLAQDDRPNAEPSCLAEGIAKEAVALDRRA